MNIEKLDFKQFTYLWVLDKEDLINLPKYALKFIDDGIEEDEMIIVAGLNKDYWEIKPYFEKLIKKLKIIYSNKDNLRIELIRIYLIKITNGEMRPFEALENIRINVLLDSNWFNKSSDFVYDYIEFQYLSGLWAQYADAIDCYGNNRENEEFKKEIKYYEKEYILKIIMNLIEYCNIVLNSEEETAILHFGV